MYILLVGHDIKLKNYFHDIKVMEKVVKSHGKSCNFNSSKGYEPCFSILSI